MKMGMDLFQDFVRFAKAQVVSGDIDPTYPVLKEVYRAQKVSREVALWRTLIFVATYHLGFSREVWTMRAPEPRAVDFTDFAGIVTGIERRGFRGRPDHAARFVNDVYVGEADEDLCGWVDSFGNGEAGWDRARAALQKARGAGPWAAYKFADLLAHVHDVDITASDLGVGGGSETAGPIPGMVALYQGAYSWQDCAARVDLARVLLGVCRKCGVPFTGLDQLETALCDFNSLLKGRYYVGHDIDDQMEKLKGCGPIFWEARSVFPDFFRGEVGGWFGIRKELRAAYRDRGEVLHAP